MKTSLAAVVLTGGKSSRMGTDKAFLPMPHDPGQTFLSHTLSLLDMFEVKVLSVAHTDEKYSAFGCLQIPDRWPEIGPMGGIASALSTLDTDAVLVLACDTPFLSQELLDRLRRAWEQHPEAGCICCADPDGQLQPLCAVYSRSALPFFLQSIEEKRYALRRVIDRLDPVLLTLDADLSAQAAANINTPEEYEKLKP